ncbi:hypothetical protein TNCV_1989901 [Trichonephila clavipes]|nr:hypothetical protein TNCV_1989901 [Trichonephila clavipes]
MCTLYAGFYGCVITHYLRKPSVHLLDLDFGSLTSSSSQTRGCPTCRPNDPRCARLEINLRIGQAEHCLVEKWLLEPSYERQQMLMQDVMDTPLVCHDATDQN